MFAEPSVASHSLVGVHAISGGAGEQISTPRRIYRPASTGFTGPTPLAEGPQRHLGLTGIFFATPQPAAIPSAPLTLSPNRTPIHVDELARTSDHSKIYKRYFYVLYSKVFLLMFPQTDPSEARPLERSPPSLTITQQSQKHENTSPQILRNRRNQTSSRSETYNPSPATNPQRPGDLLINPDYCTYGIRGFT